jgi:hypothetical protein
MSKSAGNFVTVRELLDEGVEPAAVRHLLLSAHYRSELNFTRDGLQASTRAVGRLLDFDARLLRRGRRGTGKAKGGMRRCGGCRRRTSDAVAARAAGVFRRPPGRPERGRGLAALFVFVNEANRALDRGEREGGGGLPAPVLGEARALLSGMDAVLGLLEVGRRSRTVDDDLAAVGGGADRRPDPGPGERDWGRPMPSATSSRPGGSFSRTAPGERGGSARGGRLTRRVQAGGE